MNRIGQLLATSVMCLVTGATPQQERPPVRTITPSPRELRAPQVVNDETPSVPPISLSDADGQGLILEEVSARTAIEGMLSLTELDLRFRNRPLELTNGEAGRGPLLLHVARERSHQPLRQRGQRSTDGR